MDKRDEFKNLLYNTRINNNCSTEYAHSELGNIQQWLIENTPKKLYRYRSYKEYTIDALKKDEIWGSIYSEFNDSYECIPSFDIQNFRKILSNELSYDNIYKQIENIKLGIIPKEWSNSFDKNLITQLSNFLINAQQNGTLQNYCSSLQLQIANFTLENIENFFHQFYNSFAISEAKRYIACFSEVNNSSLMWGHYADGHKGFCIEYDFNSVLKPCRLKCNLVGCNNFMLNPSIAPVIYGKTRFDATSHLITIVTSQIINSINQKMPIKLKEYYGDCQLISKTLLTKSMDWSYEKEWRLFSKSIETITDTNAKIYELKPTAVYLGIKMPKEHEEEIYQICNDKHIPCYKMITAYSDKTFNFQTVNYKLFLAEYKKHIEQE